MRAVHAPVGIPCLFLLCAVVGAQDTVVVKKGPARTGRILRDDYGVSELVIRPGDWLAHKTLGEANLDREGVTVLGIHRGTERTWAYPLIRPASNPKTASSPTGRSNQLNEIDCRGTGEEGDLLHQQACKPTAQATNG